LNTVVVIKFMDQKIGPNLTKALNVDEMIVEKALDSLG
jgi:hypothetical protein